MYGNFDRKSCATHHKIKSDWINEKLFHGIFFYLQLALKRLFYYLTNFLTLISNNISLFSSLVSLNLTAFLLNDSISNF